MGIIFLWYSILLSLLSIWMVISLQIYHINTTLKHLLDNLKKIVLVGGGHISIA